MSHLHVIVHYSHEMSNPAFFYFLFQKKKKDFFFFFQKREKEKNKTKQKNNNKKQLITKTCLYSFDPLKPHFYIVKLGFTGVYIIFLISAQNINCEDSLELPC